MYPAENRPFIYGQQDLSTSVRWVESTLWIGLALLTVILPNALKEVAVGLLVTISLYYLLLKNIRLNTKIVITWLAVVLTSAIYVIVGYFRGAPTEAGNQIIVIYIVSPFLWIICITGALSTYGLPRVVRFLILLTIIAIISQVFYYWAFASGNFQPVLYYMAGSPNLDFSKNQVAAVMFVFGSMTFLYACLFSAPEVVKSNVLRLILILSAFTSAITSGRSALILAVSIGIAIYLISSAGNLRRLTRTRLINIFVIFVVPVISGYALSVLYDIDMSISIENLIEKTMSGGGAGRQDYIYLLLEGAADYFFLGAGHGIGVEYTVSDRYPWRYEVVGAATIFRVGLIGTIVYCFPFIFAFIGAFRLWRWRGLNIYERFTLGGLFSSLIVLNTNPYIEAIVFQWMFVLPCVYFMQQVEKG
jgi:hypothetical protein